MGRLRSGVVAAVVTLAAVAGAAWAAEAPPAAAPGDDWVEPMRKVHARFKGEAGTFAHFGDSITISMAFWASLHWDHKKMDPATQAAFDLVKRYMKEDCWRKWKGPQFGNQGSMTIRWAHKNVDTWLKDLKPECALIMFGTNDLNGLEVEEYEAKTREVVQKCLDAGTVVILSTIPPKHGRDETCERFVEAVRRIARDMKVPLCDYYKAILTRRPDDWDGAAETFKSVPGGTYEVPTLISRDGTHPSNPKEWQGDYSAEGLRRNGFVLRNWVVLHSYARVVRKVFGRGDS
ncbi:MAG: SGNH/GDSL hydrolase family protein [Phycisphaerae bacterium]